LVFCSIVLWSLCPFCPFVPADGFSRFQHTAVCPTTQKTSDCPLCHSGPRVMPFMSMQPPVTMTAKQTAQGQLCSPIADSSDRTGRGGKRSEGRVNSVSGFRSTHESVVKKLEMDAIAREGEGYSVRENTAARTVPSFTILWSKRADGGD
jgi:hypothetical protein